MSRSARVRAIAFGADLGGAGALFLVDVLESHVCITKLRSSRATDGNAPDDTLVLS